MIPMRWTSASPLSRMLCSNACKVAFFPKCFVWIHGRICPKAVVWFMGSNYFRLLCRNPATRDQSGKRARARKRGPDPLMGAPRTGYKRLCPSHPPLPDRLRGRRRPSRCGDAGGGDCLPHETAAQFTCSPEARSVIVSWVPLKNQSVPGPAVSVLALLSSWTVVPNTNLELPTPTPALIFEIRMSRSRPTAIRPRSPSAPGRGRRCSCRSR